MTVYVDQIKELHLDDEYAEYGTLWCCMYADTLKELNEMADTISLSRRHLQNGQGSFYHYNLTPHMRTLAIGYGAKVVTTKELVEIIRGKTRKT